MDLTQTLAGYDKENLAIGALGGHSALEVCLGAKKQGFRTVVVARKDRAQTYSKYLKIKSGEKGFFSKLFSRKDEINETGCVDEVIEVDEFGDEFSSKDPKLAEDKNWRNIFHPEVQKRLSELKTVFVHSRYFWVYFSDFAKVENEFHVPILGTRKLLRLEERDEKPNQYDVLREAGIRLPKIFEIPEIEMDNVEMSIIAFKAGQVVAGADISYEEAQKKAMDRGLEKFFCMDRLTLTKINNAQRTYERENFVASNWSEWANVASQKIAAGQITFEDLQKATVEEFILGAQVNFNFFYSSLSKRLELLGTDTRRQTNLDGFLRLPANEQLKLTEAGIQPSHIETGHVAVTVKESLLEKAYEAGEKFVAACKEYDPRGIIGPFALQGAIETDGKKEELVVFDVSFRMPGSPGIAATPYSQYLFGRSVSLGERTAMEVRAAVMADRLNEIVS